MRGQGTQQKIKVKIKAKWVLSSKKRGAAKTSSQEIQKRKTKKEKNKPGS